MSDNDGKKTLGLRSGSHSGNVKQSFGHGRTKNVVVETKRKRVVKPKPGATTAAAVGASSVNPNLGKSKRPAGISDAEMERRLKAVQAAKAREVEEAAAREAEEKARAEERERRRAEIEAKEQADREREESLKAKADEEERAFWKRTIEKGVQEDGDLETALELLHKHNALSDTRDDAIAWAAKSTSALAHLPDHPIKQSFVHLNTPNHAPY